MPRQAVGAGGRPDGIANGASHRAGDEETDSKYAEGVRVKIDSEVEAAHTRRSYLAS